MIQTYKLLDNSVDQHIPIIVERQIIGALTTEESYAFPAKSYWNNPGAYSGPSYQAQTPDNQPQAVAGAIAGGRSELPSSKLGPTKYIGAYTVKVPCLIDPVFADFKVLNLQSNEFNTMHVLNNNMHSIESLWEDLYPTGDHNNLATIFQGQQLLRIPSHRFDSIPVETGVQVSFTANLKLGSEVIAVVTPGVVLKVGSQISGPGIPLGTTVLAFANKSAILSEVVTTINTGYTGVALVNTVSASDTDIVKNLGKYYIKISPKYFDLKITNVTNGNHYSISELAVTSASATPRATVLTTDLGDSKTGVSSYPWNFGAYPLMSGRLFGSICEVWEAGFVRMKIQKTVGENQLNTTLNVGSIVLQPDLIGMESGNNYPSTNNILRIYPRETYFDPIFIEVDYTSTTSIEDLIKYLMNDAVRDTKTGIMEIYDNNGITIDASGNVNGKVVQSFQISQENDLEIRKRVSITLQ